MEMERKSCRVSRAYKASSKQDLLAFLSMYSQILTQEESSNVLLLCLHSYSAMNEKN